MYYLLVIIFVILLFVLFYQSFIKPLQYWERKNIPYVKGLPFVGNFLRNVLRTQSFAENLLELYNSKRNDKYYGIFLFSTPFLVVQDLDLVKSIMVKSFEHFTDHSDFIFQDLDPLFVKNVFSLKGKSWHNMRSTLSPAFTGSKMRGMVPLMTESCEQLLAFLKEELRNAKKSHLELEMKNIYMRIGIDVIANTAFGLKVDSLREKDNTFFKMVSDISNISSAKAALVTICPKLMKFLNISPQATHPCKYFRNLVKETIAYREREGVFRPDMIQLLIEAKKGTLKYDDKLDVEEKMNDAEFLKNSEKLEKITDEDVAAQAFLFILGGVDTVSDLLSFVTYALAIYPQVQDRLYLEIKEILENSNGKVNYDNIKQMKYLDMITSETLRMWPPANFLDRVCTKPYTLHADGREIKVDKGERILIPAYGFHHDPNYFERPEVFDPDRFSDENKINIKPFSYMPFGMGPRNCIGFRFALLDAKLILIHLLREFEVFVTKKTAIPPVLKKSSLQLRFENDYNLGLRLRNYKE